MVVSPDDRVIVHAGAVGNRRKAWHFDGSRPSRYHRRCHRMGIRE